MAQASPGRPHLATILYGLLITAAAAGGLVALLAVEVARAFRRANDPTVTPTTGTKES